MDENFSLGYWLKRQRKARDLTQAELAQQVGIAQVTLRKIEADERRPSVQVATCIADSLQLATEEREALLHVIRAHLSPEHLALASRPTNHARRHNLPAPPNALIGRAADVANVTALVRRPDVRLVTLTGAGGSGKTRLALQVAAELLDDFSDGVWLVDLAPITDPKLIASQIAQALGLPPSDERMTINGLAGHIHGRHMLLVLDNFEQLVEAAPRLAALLAAVPDVTLLVTSRAALRLAAEHEYAVAPLAVPSAQASTADAVTGCGAAQLFVARAAATHARFALTDANAASVAAICRRLDGLPLAIELAAARVRLFPPQALLARLAKPLATLMSGPRDLPARQQTLRSTIAWSYELLGETEQWLFRRLGVFVGGFAVDAVERLWESAAAEPGPSVIDLLGALVEQSLVQQVGAADEPRFRLLETVREFTLEQQAAHGEREAAQRWHARYYFDLALQDNVTDADLARWVTRVMREYANIRVAAHWLQQQFLNRATQPNDQQKITIANNRFWATWDTVYGAMVGRFMERTGIDIDTYHAGRQTDEVYESYLNICRSAQTNVDVLQLDLVWLGEFAPYLVDLSEACRAEIATYDPRLRAGLTVEGRVVALPYYWELSGLFYRPDLLHKYGFAAPPTTWDEFEQQAHTIADGERQHIPDFVGYLFSNTIELHFEGLTCAALEWLASSGAGRIFENGELALNNPRAVAMLNRAREWIGTIAPPLSTPVRWLAETDITTESGIWNQQHFRVGKAAFLNDFAHDYIIQDHDDTLASGRVGFAPLPADPGQPHVGIVGGLTNAVLNRSPNRPAAIEFVRSIGSPAALNYRTLLGQDALAAPRLDRHVRRRNTNTIHDVYAAITPLWRPSRELGRHYHAVSRAFAHGVYRILGGADAADVLPEVEQEIRAIIGG